MCESNGDQSNRNYKAVVGVDIGIFQLNTYYQQKQAESLGFNIYTLEGNLEYGFVLLKQQGLKPWGWSEYCWSK